MNDGEVGVDVGNNGRNDDVRDGGGRALTTGDVERGKGGGNVQAGDGGREPRVRMNEANSR